jgi:uncharacterized membrane protein YgcG
MSHVRYVYLLVLILYTAPFFAGKQVKALSPFRCAVWVPLSSSSGGTKTDHTGLEGSGSDSGGGGEPGRWLIGLSG